MANLNKHISLLFLKAKTKLPGTDSSAEIFANMGKLATGVGIAKLIGFLAIPAITRIYTPEDFGILSVFISAIVLIVPLTALLYPVAIPLPKQDGLAMNLVVLSAALILTITGGMAFLFIIFGDVIFGFFKMEEIAAFWWLLMIGILATSFYELLTHWATRVKAFTEVAKTKVWQAITSAVLKIGLGLAGLKPAGLLVGDVAQRGGGVISLVKHFWIAFKKHIGQVSSKKVKFLRRYYSDLPKYRLPSQFLLKLSMKAPILFFAFQFGQEETGQLGLALAVVGMPMPLLGTSTGKAYYAEIAEIGPKNKNRILGVTKSVTQKLFLLSLLPCLVLVAAAPILFALLFGSEWELAGVFTSILALYLLVQFVTSPLINVFTVFNRQGKFFRIKYCT